MKRVLSFALTLLLVLALASPCLAAESPYVYTDSALSADEIEYLSVLFESIRQTYGVEAFFLINYDYEGGDEFKQYAKSYLSSHMEGENALVFAVSSTTYYWNVRGDVSNALLDTDMDGLYDAIRTADENGEQYNAAVQFYAALNRLLDRRLKADTPLTTSPADPDEATTAPTEPAERVIIPGSVEIPDEISPTRGDRLVDEADLLNEADEKALQEKLDTISESLQFDVVIVTARHIGNRTPMEFADDYFDYNGFGYGPNFDGVCLLISMAERDWWVSTCGYGETALLDDYFLDVIDPSDFTYYLKNADYARSFNYFTNVVNDFVIEAKTNKPFSPKHRYQDWKNKVIGVAISLVAGLIVAAIVTYSKYSNYVSSISQRSEAEGYLVGSVRFGECYDTFVGSYVNRTRRVTESSSSSSSSSSHSSPGSHTSSSGRSHGGGGGKF